MALPLSTLTTWLAAELEELGATAPVYGNWIPDSPDELVVVTSSGGATVQLNGLYEPGHLHIQSRAATDAGAEQLALKVHFALSPIRLNGSVTIGSTHVLTIAPLSPPSFLARDVSNRTIYMATYLVTSTTALKVTA